MRVLLQLLLLLLGGTLYAQVQASAKFEAHVQVVEPIRIEKAMDLRFGNVFTAFGSGNLVLSPDGIRTANGVEIADNLAGTVSPAEAVVTHSNNSYTVNLPGSIILINENNPNEVIEVNEFTLEREENLVGGKDVLRIGATLRLKADQQAGIYTDQEGFRITVSYN